MRARATASAMRVCSGRGSKVGRALASGPFPAKSAATFTVGPACSVHPGSEAPEDREALANLQRIGRTGRGVQIGFQVIHRLREAGEVVVDEAAVADLSGVVRRDE